MLDKRTFLKAALSGLLLGGNLKADASGHPLKSHKGAAQARIIIVGGGFAGATCARFLTTFSPQLEVVLVEAKPKYTACPLSNLVVTGQRKLTQQVFGYEGLKATGVDVRIDSVTDIDPTNKKIQTAKGQVLVYDTLVVAPGIAMQWNAIDGYDQNAALWMPHAWQAGAQTQLLREQLVQMQDGGLVVISVPKAPYRCPPGPYERASLIADYLKHHKPKSKLLILDSKDSFSKKLLFMQAWSEKYGDLLKWQGESDGASVVGVSAADKQVLTDFERFDADVANIIPPQQAAKIAHQAGLTDASGWCPIDALTFQSSLQKDIHVLGDAAIANAMPKSAFAANAQAKLCALQISRQYLGLTPASAKLINTCYSLVAPDYGISVADVFAADNTRWQPIKGAGGTSPLASSDSTRKTEANQALDWFAHITDEVFG